MTDLGTDVGCQLRGENLGALGAVQGLQREGIVEPPDTAESAASVYECWERISGSVAREAAANGAKCDTD